MNDFDASQIRKITISDIKSSMLASLIREKTGIIPGAEKFIINDGANFGGSPVAISLLSNNKSDLKYA